MAAEKSQKRDNVSLYYGGAQHCYMNILKVGFEVCMSGFVCLVCLLDNICFQREDMLSKNYLFNSKLFIIPKISIFQFQVALSLTGCILPAEMFYWFKTELLNALIVMKYKDMDYMDIWNIWINPHRFTLLL